MEGGRERGSEGAREHTHIPLIEYVAVLVFNVGQRGRDAVRIHTAALIISTTKLRKGGVRGWGKGGRDAAHTDTPLKLYFSFV